MNVNKKVEYLTGGREHTISKTLDYWIRKSKRYEDFVTQYREKIRKKCLTAKSFEDLEDIRFELEIPYLLLLDERFDVQYEKYGIGTKRSPDFTVIFENVIEFNIEVKRIREAILGQRFNKWLEEVVDEITKVPSTLAFSIDMALADGTSEFIDLLESKKEDIISFIKDSIYKEDARLPYKTPFEYPIPGFEDEVVLCLTKPEHKRKTDETSYHCAVEPIFYTQKELYKLGDSIFEKLGQVMPGIINILVCTSNSSTHERHNLIEAVRSINQLIKKKDESFFIRKGFHGIDDFLSYTKHLSGILFRSTWSEEAKAVNFLWCNNKAEHQIPVSIREYITRMTV